MDLDRLPFRGEPDKQAMLALARAWPAGNLHVVDLPYRLSSWALDDPDNVALWIDAVGHLLAWAVMQAPFWTIDYAYHPHADQSLHRHILAWADRRARALAETPGGLPMWFVTVFASQAGRIRDLEDAGFASQANVGEDSWSKVLLQRPSQVPVADAALPAGFSLRPLAGESEGTAYVEVHRAAFRSKNMTAGWRARTLRCPEYRADLDLVVVAPDGRLAAFCICWLARDLEGEVIGQIEPLGVHPDFRQLGIGRAILTAGLRQLHSCGAELVCVETDRQRNAALELYQAVGFRPSQEVLVYRQDYGSR
jgi:mycothiol synthase